MELAGAIATKLITNDDTPLLIRQIVGLQSEVNKHAEKLEQTVKTRVISFAEDTVDYPSKAYTGSKKKTAHGQGIV